eukprot:3454299-Rhodomonas_salina.1
MERSNVRKVEWSAWAEFADYNHSASSITLQRRLHFASKPSLILWCSCALVLFETMLADKTARLICGGHCKHENGFSSFIHCVKCLLLLRPKAIYIFTCSGYSHLHIQVCSKLSLSTVHPLDLDAFSSGLCSFPSQPPAVHVREGNIDGKCVDNGHCVLLSLALENGDVKSGSGGVMGSSCHVAPFIDGLGGTSSATSVGDVLANSCDFQLFLAPINTELTCTMSTPAFNWSLSTRRGLGLLLVLAAKLLTRSDTA